MSGVKGFLGDHQVASFFALTFLFSWYFWGAAASTNGAKDLYVAIGWLGPSLVGLVLLYALKGWLGVKGVLARLISWGGNPLFYAFAIFGVVLIIAPALFIGGWLSGADVGGWGNASQWSPVLVNFGYALVFCSLGGEIGWRGFALPRLQKEAVAIVSSLVIGVVWGAWQYPLWFVTNSLRGVYFPLFVLQMMGVSVLSTWLYNNTEGSLLITSLFTASSGAAFSTIPLFAPIGGTTTMIVAVGFLWIMVALVTVIYGPTYLSRLEKYTLFAEFSWDEEE